MSKENVLYINSCIRDDSRTERLADEYLKVKYPSDKYEKDMVKVSELSLLPFGKDDISHRDVDIKNNDFSSHKYDLAKKFASCDVIVISAPYWDNSFPSVLKVFFEHICVNKITFAYSKEGSIIKKCKAHKFIYITTCGGYLNENSSVESYLKEMCTLFTIKDLKFYAAEGLDIYGNDVEMILKNKLEEMISDGQ